MKDFQWALALNGTRFDLEDAVALFGGDVVDPAVHLVEVEWGPPITILTSPHMDELSAPHQVLGVASRLLALVNGALFVRQAQREALNVRVLYKRRDDGPWDQHGFPSHFIDVDRVGTPVVQANGTPPSQSAPAQLWVAAAQSDQVVADVLTYLSGEPNWFDIWKAFEVMQKARNTRHRRGKLVWPPDLKHFKFSVGVYRHPPPWKGGYTPEKAMTLIEARQFVQTLAHIWLNWWVSSRASDNRTPA
jgi:hypothetical protein